MNYKEFVEKYSKGEISVSVDRGKALHLAGQGYLPKAQIYAHLFWSYIWFILILVGIVLIFIKGLLVGIGVLILSLFIGSATKKSAFQFVLEYSLENKEFYNACIKNGIITVNEK